MKKISVRLFVLFLAVLYTVTARATDVTLTWSSAPTITNNTFTQNGVSFTFTKGTGANNTAPQYNSNSKQLRVYAGWSMSISVNNATITSIAYTYTLNKNNNQNISVSGASGDTNAGSYSNNTWTGSDNSVTFSTTGSSGNVGFTKIVVTYSTGGGSTTTACDAPSFDPVAGTYTSTQSVKLSTTTEGATIYYTMGDNPADPTTSSTVYSSAISVSATTTIKAIAVKDGLSNSSVSSATYTIKCNPPTFNPAAGTYTAVQSVTLNSETAGASIYYTTDGSTPSTNSTLYSSAIAVNKSMTIKAIAVKSGLTNSDVATATYTINLPYTGDEYVRVPSLDYLTDGAQVIIAARYNSTVTSYYAMTAAATGKPTGVSFTSGSSSNGETIPSTILSTSDSEDTYSWTVGKTTANNETTYTLTNANNDLLGYPSSGTDFSTGNNANTTWGISRATSGSSAMVSAYEGFYIVNKTQTGRAVALNSSHNYGPYSTSNNNSSDYNFYVDIFVKGATPNSNPSLAAEDVDIAYNGTSGSISYTLTNPKTDGEVTASITSGNTGSWLSIGNPSNGNANGTVALTCSANAGTERTATVTLTYTYDTDKTKTKEVTVTQAGDPNFIPSISEVRAQGTGAVHTIGIVTSVNGKTAYIQDNSAAIAVYDSSADLSVSVGDEIDVTGTLGTYNGLLQIQSPEISVKSTSNTVTPEVMTIAQVNASTKQGWLVKIEDATVTTISNQNVTIAQNTNTIVVRFNDSNDITFEANDVISLTGNIGNYNAVQIANPTDVSVTVDTTPTIVVTADNPVNVTAAGDSGELALSYDNFTVDNASDFDVQFYNSNNEEIENPDWITVEVVDATLSGYKVAYGVLENEGEARSAYFKVFALGTNDYIYSNLVSLSQAAPVVDFATLPFSFNKGRADIDDVVGLTHNGLGTDYTTDSAKDTKLKFDGTGDWLLLKINEAPGLLSFKIKGNTFSGGTFKVQTSADGVTYIDLATYTELDDTQTPEFNLNANVRFIKWVYTEKKNGNVGLGTISLERPDLPAAELLNEGHFVRSYYNESKNIELSKGALAYTAGLDQNNNVVFYRIGKNSNIIPAGNAVIILSSTAKIEFSELESLPANVDVSVHAGNILSGTDAEIERPSGNVYVLGIVDGVLGFYPLASEVTTIPANKAYYVAQ